MPMNPRPHVRIPPLVLCAALLAQGAITLSQEAPRDKPSATRAPTGAIRGRVVRADTGEPLRRAEVHVDEWSTGDDASGPAATMTDGDGRYELAGLPAGRYQLKARRGGYVEVAYGQRRPFERGRPLELAAGAVLRDIDFALPPGAVVTGRVVDEFGEAMAHVSVSLARRRYVEGARRLVGESGASTDDRGEFRIFGVPPGDYILVAKFAGRNLGSRDRLRYVTTYYPGTALASAAERLTVGIGQEVSGITIALARAATAAVSGVVRSSKDSIRAFTIVTAREMDGSDPHGEQATALASGDGSFTITGLLPGRYLLEAGSGLHAEASEFGSIEVVVEGSDVTGVTLMLSRGATARGRIRFDTSPPPGLRPSQVFVVAPSLDLHGSRMNYRPPVVADDWSFEVSGLIGRGFIRAGTLSDWQMERVRRGGVDVTDTPLDFSKDIDGLEIELTQRTTVISGRVLDDRDALANDATVIAFADDAEKWGPHSRFIATARPDQQGRFRIAGLPPGRYVAIALDYLEPGEERDPGLLEDWRKRGTPLTLSDGQTYTLDLKVSGS